MIAWIKKYRYFYFLPFFCLLASCSLVDKTFKPDNAAEYAELLFKRQNVITQQVMMLFEYDLTEAEEEKISQAELEMHDACHLLNEFANREIEGKKMSILFKKRVQGSFNTCDDSGQRLESILMDMGFILE